jgi:outer membrane immunogenic protein
MRIHFSALVSTLAALVLGAALPAQAADLGVRVPPVKAHVMVPAGYDWTGFYVGGNVGYSFGRSSFDWAFTDPTNGALFAAGSNSNNLNGVLGGAQAGYNWQRANWVFGVEADIQGTGQRGSTENLCVAQNACTRIFYGITQSLDWFGTLRGRVGYAVAPSWMLYVTGGLAFGAVDTEITLSNQGVLSTAGSSRTRLGWTAGAGLEGALVGNWTGKLEYLYVDLGSFSDTYAILPGVADYTHTSRVTDHIVRAGVNYRFAPAPVVARY